MRRVIVLGSSGSIGVQALQVVAAARDLQVVGLSCDRNVELLLEQAVSLGVKDIAIADMTATASVTPALYPELHIYSGPTAAAQLVTEVEADIVLNAIVGFAGLESTVAALETGKTLALANKESLVCAGSFVTTLAAMRSTPILPVDSEHSALFQLVEAAGGAAVESVVLTASGGPFRGCKAAGLRAVTPAEALAHPTWSMGRKISIDSATLANKGLEVIEAHHLFGLPYAQIEVIVHPQSVMHAAVRLVDGTLLAHLGVADMRVPIAYALHYPHRVPLAVPPLDLVSLGSIEFSQPDVDTFPALRLAYEAGIRGDYATCAFNAANEVAVHAFLDGRLPFLGIADVVAKVVEYGGEGGFGTYAEAAYVDREARERAREVVRRLSMN
ncbi:MAG: 1-deoxy-D-xylulose-5-phosphate reductoisomerase [Thermoleophilia bacterium]|jgi:1-deoxy-D-xylulose-5-phosphate reductoisomerase